LQLIHQASPSKQANTPTTFDDGISRAASSLLTRATHFFGNLGSIHQPTAARETT